MNALTATYQLRSDEVKQQDKREKLALSDFLTIKTDFESIEFIDVDDWLNFMYHCLRYLRNTCVSCKQNQNFIVESGLLDVFQDVVMEKLLSPDIQVKVQNKELLKKVRLVFSQFLGNLIVQNDETKEVVWTKFFPTSFYKMMSSFDEHSKDCLCMVLYNCLRQKSDFLKTDDEFWLALCIIEFTKDCSHTEWGLLLVELFLTSDYFTKLFKSLDTYSSQRCVLLDILNEHLAESTDKCDVNIPEKNLIFLSEVFETKLVCILMLANEVTDELVEQSTEVVKLLSVLCVATTHYEKYEKLRNKESLLIAAIKLLNGLVSSSVVNDKPLSNAKTNNKQPLDGLQRDVIRLIGNMAFENAVMQDVVRENDGIAPIMNSCNIDDSNPYIMQWSIFTIRNLCDGNVKNQDFVRSFKMKGIAPSKFLTESNIKTEVVDGKISISTDRKK